MNVTITIDNRLRLPRASLPSGVEESLTALCRYANPNRMKLERLAGARGARGRAFFFALKSAPEMIETWRIEGDDLTLPRGALARVRDVLKEAGVQWSYDDKRTKGEIDAGYLATVVHRPNPADPEQTDLRWYQEEAIAAARAKQNCLLRAPTGSGKTTTLIGLIAALRVPTLVIVDSFELQRQWAQRIARELRLSPEQIGLINGTTKAKAKPKKKAKGKSAAPPGSDLIKPITIALRQSLSAKESVLAKSLSHAFGLVVVDEVHRAAASTFIDVVDCFASRWRVGASADESRPDRKECLVYDVFGDVAHEVTRNALIDTGAVLDVECRLVPTDFRADWYVEQRETGLPDFKRLLDEMTFDEARNNLLLDVVKEEALAGEQMLVLSHRVELSTRIVQQLRASNIRAELMVGEAAELRSLALEQMSNGKLRVGVGTIQSIGTGIDLPSVGRGLLATPIGSNRQLYSQIRGRLCRPASGKRAVIYVLWDQHVNGVAPLRRMIAWNRSVLVRDGAEWVDGRAYLKQLEAVI